MFRCYFVKHTMENNESYVQTPFILKQTCVIEKTRLLKTVKI